MHKTIPKNKKIKTKYVLNINDPDGGSFAWEYYFIGHHLFVVYNVTTKWIYFTQVSVHAIWKRIQNILYCFWSSNLKCTLGLLYWKELHHLWFFVCWICIMTINLSECKQILRLIWTTLTHVLGQCQYIRLMYTFNNIKQIDFLMKSSKRTNSNLIWFLCMTCANWN